MNIPLGKLTYLPALSRPDLLGPSVARGLLSLPVDLTKRIGVAEIDPSCSDTAAFCARYLLRTEQAANCVILEAKRGDDRTLAACVVLGNTRADVNGLARRALDAKKVSFAPMQLAVERSGMEFGAITPIGLPRDWPILVDERVAHSAYVIVGSGLRVSKLAVPGELFAALPFARILPELAREAPLA